MNYPNWLYHIVAFMGRMYCWTKGVSLIEPKVSGFLLGSKKPHCFMID